ncbi:hypothetical protein BGZ61DRAFT_214180 [Ilyonectria robusta]|uniref:uncharacterized protein n=1 Tax=Ilyonectria robusta TaxID=1079257 RepID=UPI001E8CB4B5|nr:uncharacterized protein BGZ61DRAFT_214180 [Ilyonectria robusta]KAH8652927.1 hypothetical protein BGZ61DRAFT_214180 [Ilyonectria robusta]
MLVGQGGITRSSPIMRYCCVQPAVHSNALPLQVRNLLMGKFSKAAELTTRVRAFLADVFGLTKLSIEFSVLHPSQSSTRAAWRRRVATRSRPAPTILARIVPRPLHYQLVPGREIFVTERMDLDLVYGGPFQKSCPALTTPHPHAPVSYLAVHSL